VHLQLHLLQQVLITRFEQPVKPHQLLAVLGQMAAAAVPPARGAHQQRLVGNIVHRVYRIPGRLVTQAHVFRSGRDRTGAIDAFQQRDTAGADIFLAFAVQP